MRTLLSVVALVSLASAAWGEMYTWKDRRGTVFYTNSIHEIPARYLKKARVLDVATGKKGALVTQQSVPPAGTALPGQGQLPVPANAAAAPIAFPSPQPAAPLTAATADPVGGAAPQQLAPPAPAAPAAVAAPPVQTRVVLPRRPHRQPRGEEE
jgi:hypothetical protein